MDFSDDNMLVAAGMQESYIRVWSMDGKRIQTTYENVDDTPPSNSRRLIGHSGPIYAVSFAPSETEPQHAFPSPPSCTKNHRHRPTPLDRGSGART